MTLPQVDIPVLEVWDKRRFPQVVFVEKKHVDPPEAWQYIEHYSFDGLPRPPTIYEQVTKLKVPAGSTIELLIPIPPSSLYAILTVGFAIYGSSNILVKPTWEMIAKDGSLAEEAFCLLRKQRLQGVWYRVTMSIHVQPVCNRLLHIYIENTGTEDEYVYITPIVFDVLTTMLRRSHPISFELDTFEIKFVNESGTLINVPLTWFTPVHSPLALTVGVRCSVYSGSMTVRVYYNNTLVAESTFSEGTTANMWIHMTVWCKAPNDSMMLKVECESSGEASIKGFIMEMCEMPPPLEEIS